MGLWVVPRLSECEQGRNVQAHLWPSAGHMLLVVHLKVVLKLIFIEGELYISVFLVILYYFFRLKFEVMGFITEYFIRNSVVLIFFPCYHPPLSCPLCWFLFFSATGLQPLSILYSFTLILLLSVFSSLTLF